MVLTNEDGVSLIGPITTQVATILFPSEEAPAADKDTAQVKSILASLAKGTLGWEPSVGLKDGLVETIAFFSALMRQ